MSTTGRKIKRFFLIGILLYSLPLKAASIELSYQGTHILTYETMTLLAKAYYKKTGIKVNILGGGCADGISAISTGKATMGGLCCPMKPDEKNRFIAFPVAKDIKVVIVNPKNPINSLTAEQIRAIHKGRIDNWRQLGWINKPIAVIYRKHCLDRDEPVRLYLRLDNKLKALTKKAIIVRTDMDLIKYVSQFKTAIGITSKVFTKGKKVKILKINSIEPTAENVRKGLYNFTGTLYIVVNPPIKKEIKRFIEFVRGPVGQSIIEINLARIR